MKPPQTFHLPEEASWRPEGAHIGGGPEMFAHANPPTASPHVALPMPALPGAPEIGGTPSLTNAVPTTPMTQPVLPTREESLAAKKAERPQITAPPGTSDFERQKLAQEEYDRTSYDPREHGTLGKIGHVLGKIGNIAGDVLIPNVMANVPGTDLNKRLEEAGTRRALGETEQRESAAKTAETNRENVESEIAARDRGKVGVTDEEVTLHDLMTGGEGGTPRINPDTQQPYQYLEAYQKVKQAAQDVKPAPVEKLATLQAGLAQAIQKGDPAEIAKWQKAVDDNAKTSPGGKPTEEDKAISDYLQGHGLEDSPKNRDKVRDILKTRDRTPKDPELAELSKDIKKAQLKQLEEKGNADIEAADAAVSYAENYVKSGQFTGPRDEALMEKYFEVARPSKGFRMTQPQQDMLNNSQSWSNSAGAKLRHATVGTWYSDQQRKEIVDAMKDLNTAKHAAHEGGGGETGGAKTFDVQLPQGKGVKHFKTQEDADAFKKEAKIK
jgi:hypothetical protein